jgi:5-methylcytosine-specific restriction endonuclease McrA
MNGRANRPDRRGNNIDRHNRRAWLLRTYGDGKTARCVHCDGPVDDETMHVDRIVPGGSYRRDNIQVSCESCNIARGDDPTWVHPSKV